MKTAIFLLFLFFFLKLISIFLTNLCVLYCTGSSFHFLLLLFVRSQLGIKLKASGQKRTQCAGSRLRIRECEFSQAALPKSVAAHMHLRRRSLQKIEIRATSRRALARGCELARRCRGKDEIRTSVR